MLFGANWAPLCPSIVPTPPLPSPRRAIDRALARLEGGEVDAALAETMRLPGAANADKWIVRARRYIAAHRALDEIEFRRTARQPFAADSSCRGPLTGLATAP